MEIGMSLSMSEELLATSFVYLHAAVKELSLTQLGSDAIALAAAAVLLAAKTKESSLKQNEIIEVAVKLASSDKPTLSIESFAERKKIMKDKSGFFETMIIRIQALDVPLGFHHLAKICQTHPVASADLAKIAHKLLYDFYRSSIVLDLTPDELAHAAKQYAALILSDDSKTSLHADFPWLSDLLEDVYT